MTDPRRHPGVILVDDHRAVRQCLASLLEEEGLCVWEQADGRADALAAVARERPDVVLVGLSLETEDGVGLVTDLHRLGIPVVVCSSREGPEPLRRALAAGARAYVAKREAGRALAHAIRDALNGWILVGPRAANDLDADDDAPATGQPVRGT